MALNPKTEQTGTAGGTAINIDISRIEPSAVAVVRLSAAYTTQNNAGDPSRPQFTGAAFSNLDTPGRTIASGTVLELLAGEAAALVAAGKATYVYGPPPA